MALSTNVIYRDRQAHAVDDYVADGGWVGLILDLGDGLTFGVSFADQHLLVDPTDNEWFDAQPLLTRLPSPFVMLPDGTAVMVHGPSEA